MPPIFADVIFPQRLTQGFTYRIPASWQGALKMGHWVLAPFGRTARPGFVVGMSDQPSDQDVPEHRIRELEDHLTPSSEWNIDSSLIALAQWMADYYIAPLGVCFQWIQPPRLPYTTASRLRLTPLGQQALARGRLSELPRTILDTLRPKPKGLTLATLKKLVPTAPTVVTQLKRKKWVEELHVYHMHSTLQGLNTSSKENATAKNHTLFLQDLDSISYPSWWKDFQHSLKQRSFNEYFIDEIGEDFSALLVQSIRETLDQKRTALIIVPDMAQAAYWAQFLSANLNETVGLFHSGLAESGRMKEWLAINLGRYQIVVGTRMAVFAPVPSLGLLVLCHEDDDSYKEEQSPYYHARDVARERACLSRAGFILHSPHPTLETAHHFSSMRELNTAQGKKPHAVHVVDHHSIPYGTTLSNDMRNGMTHALSAGGGIVIFHNRKGFSSSIVCRDCGLSAQCESCQVPCRLLTAPPIMRCPYCGQTAAVPTICPACSGSHLEPGGYGTERLEQELRKEFPTATVGRMDRNNVRTESAAKILRDQFNKGQFHILICTEMVFHVGPLSPVRFVGIPYADAGLHLPDFRSAERLYHHLQSAVNLLTSNGNLGQAVIQTRLPTHHVMQAMAQQQPSLFYEHELAFRQAVGYPPFVHFIQMSISGAAQMLVKKAATHWVQILASQVAHNSSQCTSECTILGPIASQALRHRRVYRETILFKASDVEETKTALRRAYGSMTSNKEYRGLRFGINVDPTEVL